MVARRADVVSPAQEAVVRSVRRRVRAAGQAPSDLSQRGALQELLKTDDVYSGEGGSLRAPYRPGGVKVLDSAHDPRDLEDVAASHVLEAFRHPERFIEKTTAEIEADPPTVEPYWDPNVDPRKPGNRAAALDLVRALVRAGLVGGRTRKKADVGLFFLEKKDGRLRMVLDARQSNHFHRRPPYTALATPDAIARISLEDEIAAAGRSSLTGVVAGSVDLCDGFYQFRSKRMASWFGINLPGVTSGELGIDTIFDEELGRDRPIAADEFVWPCFQALPMG